MHRDPGDPAARGVRAARVRPRIAPTVPWSRWDHAAVAMAFPALLLAAIQAVVLTVSGSTRLPIATGSALAAAGMSALAVRAAVTCRSRERVVWILYAGGTAAHAAADALLVTMGGDGRVPGPVTVLQVTGYLLFLAGSIALAVVCRALATTASLLDMVLFVTAVVSLVAIVTPAVAGRAGPLGGLATGGTWLLFAIPPALNLAVACSIALQVGLRRVPWTVPWIASALLLLAGATVLASYQASGHPGIATWEPLLTAARLAVAILPLWVIVRGRGLADGLPPLRRTTGPAVTVATAAAVVAIAASLAAAGGGGVSRADTIVAVVVVLLLLTLARATISARMQRRISRARQAQAQAWARQSGAAVRNAERLRAATAALAPEVDRLHEAVAALRDCPLPAEASRAVDQMSRATLAVEGQIRGMAAFADVPAPAPVPTDVSRLVADIVRAHGPGAARAGMRLDVDVADDQIAVVDPGLLTRIVENLVSNAIRYAGPGSSAAVRASVVTTGAGTRNLVVVVSDTGRGVPESLRAAVFRPFYRVRPDDDVPGTGIGLASAARCAGALSGSLDLSETPGGGATFTLTVPAEPPPHGIGSRQPVTYP